MTDTPYLERQTAVIPLVKGLDLKTDKEVTPTASLVRLENASFHAPGAIAKDDGYLTLTGVASTSRLIEGSPNTLISTDSGAVYEYQSSANAWRSLTQYSSPLACAAAERIDDTSISYSRNFKCGDYATYGDTEAIIYADSTSTVKAQVREISTGVLLTKDAVNVLVVSGVTQTYVVVTNGLYVFAWVSAGTIGYSTWDPVTRAVTLTGTLATDNRSGTAPIDLIADSTAGRIWIAYSLTGGGRGIKLVKYAVTAGTTVSLGTLTQSADTADQWISLGLDSSDGSVLCAYQSSTAGTKMFGIATGVTLRSSSTIDAADVAGGRGTVVCHNSPTGMLIWEKSVATFAALRIRRCLVAWDGSGGAATTPKNLYGHTLTHRAFVPTGTSTVWVGVAYYEGVAASAAANQRVLWTASIDPLDPLSIEPICSYLYDLISDPTTWVCGHIVQRTASVIPGSVTEYGWLGAVADQKSGDPGTTAQAIALCKLRLSEGQAVSIRGVPYLAGSLLYSGPGVAPASFFYAPTISASITYSNVGGGGLVAGSTYQWQAVFELRCPDGTLVRSIASNIVSGTVTGGNNKATLSVTVPMVRGVASTYFDVFTKLYRTQAGPGATFTLVGAGVTSEITNSTTPANFADSASDASIASNQLVYTTGGVLDAYPFPMVSALALHQNRVFGIDEFSREIRYTRDIVEGEAPCWHPNLAVSTSGIDLLPTALISTGNGLWALGRDKRTGAGAAALLVGSGPDDTGASSTYELQRLENCDVGPTHWRQAVNTPAGIIFEDPYQGYHLLEAGGGNVTGVGLPAELQRTFPVSGGAGATLAMHVLQDRKEIRCLIPNDSSGNRMLVYHYDVGAWSQRAAIGPPKDAAVWLGTHVQLDTSGNVARHQLRRSSGGSVFADRGSFYALALGTGWVYFAGNAGQQQVYDIYLCGKFKASVGLTVNLYYDGNDSSADAYTFSASDLSDNSTDLRVRVRPRTRRMERFKIEIIDTNPGSGASWEGIQWNAIRVEYGTLSRGRKSRTTGLKG
jgi:hypothetical protein